MNVTGRLEDWYIAGSISDWEDASKYIGFIWGTIYDDAKNRFPDGSIIHTSAIWKNKLENLKEGDIVETQFSSYLLGKPFSVE